LKILSISSLPLLPHLGSGKTRLHWTEGLRQFGNTVDVLEPKDFELWTTLKKGKKYRMAVGILFAVKKILKKNTYDIIEFYGDEYWLLLLWLKKMKKKTPLLVAHADAVELNDMDKAQKFWDKRKGFVHWIYRHTHYRFAETTFSLAGRLVCGNQNDLNYVLGKKYFTAQQAVCIAPGIEDSFHDLPFTTEKENIVVFVGSWIKRKGVDVVVDVMNTILAENNSYQFYIIGSGAHPETVQQAFDAAVRSRVKVFEQIELEALQQNLMKTAVFFFPSYSEGFGLAVAEAMSCSCAAVITPEGIGGELVHQKEALICRYDDINTMTESINCLIKNKAERIRIAYNGWLKAKEYRWKDQVKKLASAYCGWL
jgi:glycosyltransferase involved in cell wall biosynthesis